ncbi:MAG: hydroxymethylbilane synthase [Candidatus Bathyarchaeota archaeon]|nr:hydroxymethylbilane synthase [Candidatus Bathyarchaeota archaeon]
MMLTVGTRGSKLALRQTESVIESLKRIYPEVEFKIKVIKTTGDKERKKPLFTIDMKGIFEKEIDMAIAKGEVDFAVHSLKDVPTLESADTVIAAIPKRSSPHDVLITRDKTTLHGLPKGAVIGTGSLRRLAQIRFLRADLQVVPIRGNVDTRIRKVKRGEVDGIIIAEAGLERMRLQHLIAEHFPLEQIVPAAGQGALAVVTKKDNHKLIKLLNAIDHPSTRAEVTAERSLILSLEGGCRVPIGAIGRANKQNLKLYGCMFSLKTGEKIAASAEGTLEEAEDIGRKVAQQLLEQGAKKFEAEWREKYG